MFSVEVSPGPLHQGCGEDAPLTGSVRLKPQCLVTRRRSPGPWGQGAGSWRGVCVGGEGGSSHNGQSTKYITAPTQRDFDHGKGEKKWSVRLSLFVCVCWGGGVGGGGGLHVCAYVCARACVPFVTRTRIDMPVKRNISKQRGLRHES